MITYNLLIMSYWNRKFYKSIGILSDIVNEKYNKDVQRKIATMFHNFNNAIISLEKTYFNDIELLHACMDWLDRKYTRQVNDVRVINDDEKDYVRSYMAAKMREAFYWKILELFPEHTKFVKDANQYFSDKQEQYNAYLNRRAEQEKFN